MFLPGFYGLADVDSNAKELAANVEKVKTLTGAEKVDIVGHSQGAMLAKKYIVQLARCGQCAARRRRGRLLPRHDRKRPDGGRRTRGIQ